MSHLVHDVVGHVAVNHPVAGGVCVEFDIPRLPDSDQYRGLWPLGRKGDILAVGRRDPKVVTVQVNGVVVHLTQGRPLHTPTVLGTALFGGEKGLTGPDPFHASWETTLMFTWVHGLAFILIGGIVSLLLGLAERNPNVGFGILLLFVILEFGFVMAAFILAEPILGLLAWPAVLVGNLLAASAMSGYFWYRHRGMTILP